MRLLSIFGLFGFSVNAIYDVKGFRQELLELMNIATNQTQCDYNLSIHP